MKLPKMPKVEAIKGVFSMKKAAKRKKRAKGKDFKPAKLPSGEKAPSLISILLKRKMAKGKNPFAKRK